MNEEKKPHPLEDVRQGLGLLFRAAKTAVESLPTKDLEKSVTEGMTEFGKVVERVVEAIGKEVQSKTAAKSPPAAQASTTDEQAASEVRVGSHTEPEHPEPAKADPPAGAKADSDDPALRS